MDLVVVSRHNLASLRLIHRRRDESARIRLQSTPAHLKLRGRYIPFTYYNFAPGKTVPRLA